MKEFVESLPADVCTFLFSKDFEAACAKEFDKLLKENGAAGALLDPAAAVSAAWDAVRPAVRAAIGWRVLTDSQGAGARAVGLELEVGELLAELRLTSAERDELRAELERVRASVAHAVRHLQVTGASPR
jgi:hypothetical protein